MELHGNYERLEQKTEWGDASQSHASALPFQHALLLSASRELQRMQESWCNGQRKRGGCPQDPRGPPGIACSYKMQRWAFKISVCLCFFQTMLNPGNADPFLFRFPNTAFKPLFLLAGCENIRPQSPSLELLQSAPFFFSSVDESFKAFIL